MIVRRVVLPAAVLALLLAAGGRARAQAAGGTPTPTATPAATPTPDAGASLGSAPDYTGRKITAVAVTAPRGYSQDELSRFLEVHPGDAYSARSVRRSIEVLSKLGDFSSIDVNAREEGSGIALVFRLVAVPRIRKILVNGKTSVPPRVRSAVGVVPGDPYPGDQDLVRMADEIQQAYVRDGWKTPRVEVKSTIAEDRQVTLDVTIDPGPRRMIREIRFLGDFQGAFEEKELLAATKLEMGDAVRESDLLEARRRLLAYHRALGFYEAKIPKPLDTADVDRGPTWGKVTFIVNSGDQILFEFRKKKISWADQKKDPLFWWDFRDSKLLSLLDLENESQFTEGFGDEACDRIADYYRREGWMEAKVSSEMSEEPAKRRKTFVFTIDPGRRFRIASISIKGADDSDPVTSASTMKTVLLSQSAALREGHFVADDLEYGLTYLANYLRSEGFAESHVDARDPEIDRVKHTVKLAILVEPGPRSRVGTITFEGNEQAPAETLAGVIAQEPAHLKPGEPLNIVYLDRAEQAIADYYATIGFPYAKVTHAAHPGAKKGDVDVDFKVDESVQAFIGRVIVKGNRFTRREVIDRALPFHTGQSYNPQELKAAQDSLQKLGIFNQINVVPFAEEEPERVRDILVGVSEANRILIEPSVGASTEQGPRIGLRAQHLNLFGTAKSLTLRVQSNWLWQGLPQRPEDFRRSDGGFDVSQIEGRVILTYAQPTTFNQPVDSSVSTSLFEKFQTRTWGYTGNRLLASADRTVKLDRVETPLLRDANLVLAARYQLFLRDILYEGPSGVKAEEVALEPEDYSFPSRRMYYWPLHFKIASGSVSTLLDRRDDRANPTKGYSASLTAELAAKSLGSDIAFGKVTGGVTVFERLPADFRLVAAARGGYAKPLGSATGIPIDQRFHLGGTGSVRGFREDSIGPRFANTRREISTGGDVMALYNIEIRHPFISSGVYWALFHDAGWTKILETANVAPRESPDPSNPGLLLRGPLVNSTGLSTSVGVGLGIWTPVGPAKFDLGVDTRSVRKLNTLPGWENEFVLHFTIGDF